MWSAVFSVALTLAVLGFVLFLPQILFALELWAVQRELKEEDNGN